MIDNNVNKKNNKTLKIIIISMAILVIIIVAIYCFYKLKNKKDTDYAQIKTESTNKSTSPINGIKAGKLTITLADNSKNTITDSETYTKFTDTENLEPDGAIFTKTDLIINGRGKLSVNANYSDGIVSKDELKIINSDIEINSKDDGIRGKDYVAINNAKLTITSKGDGIKSTNDTDTNFGYIVIEGGTININSECDGIQAETILNISENANINITTTGEITSSKTSQDFGPGFRSGFNQSSTTTVEEGSSSKALKAGTEITIESGNIEISSTDDAIHSNGIVIINDGKIKVSSGDDGIHADTNIAINGGSINITKSYEGIESGYIEINGGTILDVASDDGINISGGNDSSSLNGRNAALDYDSECVVTGGDIIIYGATGMWQNPSNNSTQYCLTFQNSGSTGDEVILKDSDGTEITSFKTEKTYGAITISNSSIEKGKTYILYVNGKSVGTLQANSVVTSNTSSMGNGMQPNKGGLKGNF